MSALAGVRVLDLTNVLSGPFCTLHLALLGAEVVKVENPKAGDLARVLGNVAKYNKMLMGTSFLAQNANKRSLTLNLKTPEGKQVFEKLVAKADVVVENFRPDVMPRLGLGYPALAAINPRLVYCGISCFGESGPDAGKPAYDQIIQGMSGIMDVNGDPRLHPLRTGFPVCDTVGGLNAAFAILPKPVLPKKVGEVRRLNTEARRECFPLRGGDLPITARMLAEIVHHVVEEDGEVFPDGVGLQGLHPCVLTGKRALQNADLTQNLRMLFCIEPIHRVFCFNKQLRNLVFRYRELRVAQARSFLHGEQHDITKKLAFEFPGEIDGLRGFLYAGSELCLARFHGRFACAAGVDLRKRNGCRFPTV